MRQHTIRSTRHTVAVLCAAAVILVAGSAASAQGRQRGGGFGGFGGFQGGGGTAISSRDIGQYSDILALDDEQREVVTLLFESYLQEFQDNTQAMRDQMQEARDGGGGFEGFADLVADSNAKRDTIQSNFLGDIRAILSSDQEANWPKVDRAITRNAGLRQGTLSGERVDVVRLVGELELASDTTVAPILEEYEITLDGAIKRRDELRSGLRQRSRDGDPGDAFTKMRSASERVRDTNRTFARQIESALGSEDGTRFAASFQRASYPQVYRPGRGQRALEAALGFEDITADQKASLDALNDGYTQDTSALNKKYVAEIDKAEREGTSFGNRGRQQGRDAGGQRGGGRGGDRGGDRQRGQGREGQRPQRDGASPGGRGQGDRGQRGQGRGPGSEIAQEKRDLDTKTVERVGAILTDAQSTRLDKALEASRGDRQGQRGQQRRRDR